PGGGGGPRPPGRPPPPGGRPPGLRTRHGLGLLLITHDLAVTARQAERVLVLADSRTVGQGRRRHRGRPVHIP
ncbi:hypothetical protein, partial [Frankia nepalensis]|uniref:hypothetical protein n=1 Tax=Frankia nepalensis TaxID=1836974 RepID=UPI003969D2BE